MSGLDDFKKRMKKDMETYDKEGNTIKAEIVNIFVKYDVSPLIAHTILREMMKIIEHEEPAIKMANDVIDDVFKKLNEKEK